MNLNPNFEDDREESERRRNAGRQGHQIAAVGGWRVGKIHDC